MGPIDIQKTLNSTPSSEVSGSRSGHFWELQPFDGGATWIGKWQGESPWERHSKGDEYLHVLQGQVEVQLVTATGKKSIQVSEGSVFVVPRNHWHRQIAREQVTVLGATPGVTDHSDIEPVYDRN